MEELEIADLDLISIGVIPSIREAMPGIKVRGTLPSEDKREPSRFRQQQESSGLGDEVIGTPIEESGTSIEYVERPSVTKPRRLYAPDPEYTQEALDARIEGVVVLDLALDRQGRVIDIEVLKGLSHGLTESAVEAVREWYFQPATVDLRPVAVRHNIAVHFELKEQGSPPG